MIGGLYAGLESNGRGSASALYEEHTQVWSSLTIG